MEQFTVKTDKTIAMYRGGDETRVFFKPLCGGARYTYAMQYQGFRITMFARTPAELQRMILYTREQISLWGVWILTADSAYTQFKDLGKDGFAISMHYQDYLHLW